jgi:dihydroorotase
MELDLLVRGGRVVDPGKAIDDKLDIGVRLGRIQALDTNLEGQATNRSAMQIVDATDALVVPGLIDIHAHVYTGVCPLAVPADEMASRSGVTTIVSAGDAGANTIEGFRDLVFNRSRTRVLAFLHISTVGLAPFPVGEAIEPALLDPFAAERAIGRFPDMIVGLKVRLGGPTVTGANGLEALRRAVSVGQKLQLPVMVHITDSDVSLMDVLAVLNRGDIVTHCFTGSANGLIEEGGIDQAAVAARRRGVLFDVGHGAGSFDFQVAEAAARIAFWPDTISTDLHSISFGKAKSLPSVMSKMLALGIPLNEVIAAATSRAAQAIGRDGQLGSLRVGVVADIAILDLKESPVEFADTFGHNRAADRQFEVRHTIRAGAIWGAPSHPGLGTSVLAESAGFCRIPSVADDPRPP